MTRYVEWSGALSVTALTAVLVVLDLADGPVHRYWSRHAFAASVLSGLLVLLLTVLIVDRVTRMRQLRYQSRAIAAQAAVILAQATRTADAISRPAASADDRDDASAELRTYTQMLLTSAPLLIDAAVPRAFLETAQRVAGQMFRALRAAEDGTAGAAAPRLDTEIERLRTAAAPLMSVLNREQRAAVSSDDDDGDPSSGTGSGSG
jgi:hypothetical protein